MRKTWLLLALLAFRSAAATDELASLEARLARTPPVSTPFVEFRFSHVLKRPLRVSGTLEYRADGILVRSVAEPYRERTEAHPDSIRIQREGKPLRVYETVRVPQLAILLDSFRAFLDGHLAQLAASFEIATRTAGEDWTIMLTPRDTRLAKRLARIEMHGVANHSTCMETVEPDGDATVTLYESAPALADPPTRAAIEQHCREHAAH